MKLADTRVLVTGASGFIGSHLVHRLLNEGAQVGITVRYANLIKNVRLTDCWECLHIIEADLRNRGALAAIASFQPQVVFHLAAYNHVGQSFTQVEECFDVNAKGTANLLDVCSAVPRFVYISSSEVYGQQDAVPFVESTQPRPMSPYAITKYAGELYCRMKQLMAHNCGVVLLRPFNAFGPGQSTKAIIPELILKALRGEAILTTSGEQTREFNYVTNIVDGILLAALTEEPLDGPVNVCGGEEVRIRDLVQKIVEMTGSSSRVEMGALSYRPNEIWRMYGDSTRARDLLGWKPGIDLESGLAKTVEWFSRHVFQAEVQHAP